MFPPPESPKPSTGEALAPIAPIPPQAETDLQLIHLWLHGRSPHTISAYWSDAERFLRHAEKPLRAVTLGDLQVFGDFLASRGVSAATCHRGLSAVKSLCAFGFRIGYLPFDVGQALRLPGYRDVLADRLLTEGEVQRMLALESHPRNHALLVLLYAAGLRVSELCSLRWSDLQPRDVGGQVTVCGKRQKTRTVLLPGPAWATLRAFRLGAADADPVFRSRRKGPLSKTQVWRVVRRAAARAGVPRNVSPHWLRHGHASHALDRGAPISLVQSTLGHASVATTGRYLHARPSSSSSTFLRL
jgi:integrase/recombinase XerD